ncbi:hypothetical protein RCL1_005566 [Eukaryota sp. TZLM3-RCL]
MAKQPSVKWAQRKDKVFLIVDLAEPSNITFDLTPTHFTFNGRSDLYKQDYTFALEFFADIDKETSSYHASGRNVTFVLMKANQDTEYWPRLTKPNIKHPWLAVDWNLYVDEDEEGEQTGGAPDMPFDMSQFQNMPDFSSMGNLGAMDDGSESDSAGEELEATD